MSDKYFHEEFKPKPPKNQTEGMSGKYFQGKFKPKNPKKYTGNVKNIIYRSSYEFSYMRTLDNDPNVLQWASEEMHIAYPCPFDKEKRRWRRYFPDFVVKRKLPNGKVITEVIEIKPHFQTVTPAKGKKKTKTQLNEATTYVMNKAKWEAAEAWCKKRGYVFKILTEKDLFGGH